MSETTIVGRQDYGWGIEAREVEIEGHQFLIAVESGRALVPCGHCDGGHSGSKSHFGHVLGAVCFQCNGTGVSKRLDSIEDATRIAKRRNADAARRARKEADRLAAAAAERDAWATAHADLADRLLSIRDETGNAETEMESYRAAEKYGEFLVSLAHRSGHAPLTEAQTEAAVAALIEHDERAAAEQEKAAVQRHYGTPGEKVAATGVVVVSMNVDGYAYGSTDRMVVIEGTGEFVGVTFKASGSGATLFATERGDQVEFTATIKKHADYQGTPQTVITRAKITVLAPA